MKMRPPLVAIVDDDQSINSLVAELLRDEGYAVACCFTSAEALELARRSRPDLMIIDMQLETRDAGLELLGALRADQATARLPVIICSADSLALHRHARLLSGHGALVVPKPFQIDRLLTAVGQLL